MSERATLLLLLLPALVIAIVLPQMVRAYVANWLGDPTPKMLGRLTINPFKHIDPIGTVVVPGLLFIAGGFLFGWGRPVPISERNLKNPSLDLAFISGMTLAASLLLVFLWTALASLLAGGLIGAVFGYAALLSAALFVIGLTPLPPLDGGVVLKHFLPRPAQAALDAIEPYVIWVLLALMLSGVFQWLYGPLVLGVLATATRVVGLLLGA